MLLLAVSLVSCTHEPQTEVARPVSRGVAPQSSAQAPAPRVKLTGCAARPSTVYGQEEVVFQIEAEAGANALLGFELLDERGRSVSKGTMVAPGELKPPELPSGDFVLVVGDDLLRCAVTVNRELSRASQMTR